MNVSSNKRLTSALMHLLHTERQSGVFPAMSRIAAEAGISEAEARAIYPTEHDILLAIGKIGWMKLFDMATRSAVMQDPNDPVAQMMAIGEAYLDWAFDDPALFLLVHDRNRFSYIEEEELQRHINAMRQLVEDLLTRAMKMGFLPPDDDIKMQLLASRSYLYGLARMYSDDHYAEWVPGSNPRELAGKAFREFIERVMGSRSEWAVRKQMQAQTQNSSTSGNSTDDTA